MYFLRNLCIINEGLYSDNYQLRLKLNGNCDFHLNFHLMEIEKHYFFLMHLVGNGNKYQAFKNRSFRMNVPKFFALLRGENKNN